MLLSAGLGSALSMMDCSNTAGIWEMLVLYTGIEFFTDMAPFCTYALASCHSHTENGDSFCGALGDFVIRSVLQKL